MSSQGPNFPAAATGNTNAIGGGTAADWTNPQNIEISDGNSATVVPGVALTKDLIGTGFGFAVPAGATILGIQLEINGNAFVGGIEAYHQVFLIKSGAAVGINKATGTLPSSAATSSFGGATDQWGTTWTPADVNSASFGAAANWQSTGGGPGTVSIDFYRVTVFYSNNVSDGTTGAVTTGATDSAQLAAAGASSSNVTAAATESATLAAVAAITGGVTLSAQETGVRTLTGFSGAVMPGVTFATAQNTAGTETESVALATVVSSGLLLPQSDTVPVHVEGYQTAFLEHAPLPCGDITEYLNLITSQHNKRPKFMATVALLVQAMRDMQCLLKQFSSLFDIARAVGDQLDTLGMWIGVPRNIAIPLQNTVFFSWNTSGLGWNQGKWFGAGDSLTGYVTLSDEQYRTLLLARVASNMWDGTVPGAYAIWNLVFSLQGFQLLIQDNQDMSISIIFLTTTVDAVTQAMLVNGYLTFRPAGVRIAGYFKAQQPVFGWGTQNGLIAGWGTGSWLQTTQIG